MRGYWEVAPVVEDQRHRSILVLEVVVLVDGERFLPLRFLQQLVGE